MRTSIKASMAAIVVTLTLTACTGNNNPINPSPTLAPAPSVSETTANPEPTTDAPTHKPAPTKTTPENPPVEGEENYTPKPSATSDAAAPPATQFAQRWGAKYPNVPEFAILKAANATCRLIESSGTNWNDSATTMTAITAAASAAGISGNDALEFAQDADQNYCSSVSNPT